MKCRRTGWTSSKQQPQVEGTGSRGQHCQFMQVCTFMQGRGSGGRGDISCATHGISWSSQRAFHWPDLSRVSIINQCWAPGGPAAVPPWLAGCRRLLRACTTGALAAPGRSGGHIEGRLGAPAPVEGGLSGGAGPPNHASQPPRGAQLRSPLLLAARQVPPAPAPAGPSGDRPSTLLAVSRGRSRALLLPDCHIEGGVHVHPVHVSLVSALQALHLKARICRRRGGRGACALRHVVQVPPPSHHGSCSPVVGSGARAEEFASACRGHPPGL